MAYYITSDGTKTNTFRIAENDSAKNNLGLASQCVSHTISSSEFNYLKNNTKIVSGHDGTNFIYSDIACRYPDAANLTIYINIIIDSLNSALERYPNHADASNWKTYKNYLNSFDTSTVTFPLEISWEKYCEDNSITYINTLELP